MSYPIPVCRNDSACVSSELRRQSIKLLPRLAAEDSLPSPIAVARRMQGTMEATSLSSLCRAFPISRTSLHDTSKTPFVSFQRHSALSLNSSTKKTRITRTIIPVKASENHANASTSQLLGLLLEVEGVLVDLYRFGHRQAFNSAFQKLGLDCANWTDPIYLDLARKACGDEKRMLVLFFNRIGWPTSLPTNEKENFMKSVLREKQNALDELAMTKGFSLRPGVEDFIDDACNDGIPMVFLTAYGKNGEKMARAVIGKLGHERISKIKVVGKEEVEGSFYGQLVLGKGVSSTLDEQLAREAVKAASVEKQRIAEEVASMLKLSVDIDTIPAESLDKIVATLRAGAESACVPVSNCILIAGSQSGLLGAERVGMHCVVLRNSFTARAEFSSANAVMDGFGGADLTLSKLKQKRWQ